MKFLLFFFLLILALPLMARPNWVNKPEAGCKESELCAVGVGSGMETAKASARNNISKIFETKIKSEFTSSLEGSDESSDFYSKELIEEETKSILEGTIIREVFEGKTEVYALAALDKFKMARSLKKEITSLDTEMAILLKQGGASRAIKAQSLYLKRNHLASQYYFLTKINLPEIISYEEVFKNKKNAIKDKIIHLTFDGERSKELETIVMELLVSKGFKVTTGKKINKKATHLIQGKFESSPEFLKVDGFEKYKFLLSLEVTKSGEDVKIGHLLTEELSVGRTFDQAFSKALPEIKLYLEEHYVEFNIN